MQVYMALNEREMVVVHRALRQQVIEAREALDVSNEARVVYEASLNLLNKFEGEVNEPAMAHVYDKVKAEFPL